ncbi:MAG: MATE family efflux transporter [Rikenellaceae bacterium]|nr:MATE family efflux transporter [Rikenellaceae bacterium]
MASAKDILLAKIRSNSPMTGKEQLRLSLMLGLPAILAQLSNILMQYIDASMVGHLGATQAASIGLVSSSTWLFGGLCMATTSGFSVQIAQLLGAGNGRKARDVMRKGLVSGFVFSIVLGLIGISISSPLPYWLGGKADIASDASSYFLIYSAAIPFMQIGLSASGFLAANGNLKVPSIIFATMCLLDVVFNYLFIYICDMGVMGAAVGTAAAELFAMAASLWYLLAKSRELNLKQDRLTSLILDCRAGRKLNSDESWQLDDSANQQSGYGTSRQSHLENRQLDDSESRQSHLESRQANRSSFKSALGNWLPDRPVLKNAFGISGPLWLQNIVMRGAYVIATIIVAPLGTIAIAANAFAIIAESFCYMPGYGMADAVTPLVGQSIGAGRKDYAKRFAWINIGIAGGMMGFLAVLMYIFAPQMMSLLTSDTEVIALGVKCLRIVAFAEFLYGVSIVGYGACVGAGDTMIPTVMNFSSMWIVRIGLALILTPKMGLVGYWIAMCIELNARGIIFALRIKGNAWLKKSLV